MPLCSSLQPASRSILNMLAPFCPQRRQGPGKLRSYLGLLFSFVLLFFSFLNLLFVDYDDESDFEEMEHDHLFVQEVNQAVCGSPSYLWSWVFVEMAVLMNRSRGLAEGVVVMVCPVLLALALDKVEIKVYGRRAFIAMLAMAGITLISGICPLLACCFSERFPGVSYVRPAPVTASLATLSSSCLLVLACFIAHLLVSKSILITVGVLCGACVLVRAVLYYVYPTQNDGREYSQYTRKMHRMLDESHEFLTGVTGILFLGLEGLALESHGNQLVQQGGPVGTISFIVCALGVCLMYLEMTPPPNFVKGQIMGFTLMLDITMAVATFTLLMVVMVKLMGRPALVLFTPPVVIVVELVYRVAVRKHDNQNQRPPINPKERESMPASLELTRVTFTGFLAVSVTAISNASPSKLTGCFLLFAAAAIVFGLSWRLLSQTQIRRSLGRDSSAHVASSANLASLCTHFCIVIATILFLAMAGTAREK